MAFFDFNIPYFESDKPITNNPARKATRLKLIVKAMELGYTGIAYNRSIKGVMSESDRCAISLFPLSSVLKLSPSLTSTVNFHRNLLGVPVSTPFRQYTRLTVIVDSSSQASALNSGNPILKTYDIVAVRPVNQNAFEQACRASEVDLIAIDFSEKLPYRLKQPLVKAAIERGVYFEITYSSLILDAQVRRQMISSAKLLVDWTRGKNLIFSSAAPSITELRGPYDVANLMSLLGIPTERAKAAISKNCRSLIANSLRKKKFYKEAIRVELVSSTEQCFSKDPEFGEWLKWDPISSGEGDLLLDEMAKSFAASNTASKRSKAIDFASIVDSLPPQGLQINNLVPVTKLTSKPLNSDNNLSLVKKASEPVAVSRASEKEGMSDILSEAHQSSLAYATKDKICSSVDSTILADDSMKGLTDVSIRLVNHENKLDCVHSQACASICEPPETFPADNADDIGNKANETKEDTETEVSLHVCLASREAEVHDLQADENMPICPTVSPSKAATANTRRKDEENAQTFDVLADTQISEDHYSSALPSEECKLSSSSDLVLDTQDVVMDEITAESDIKVDALETFTISKDGTNIKGESNLPFTSNLSSHETITNREYFEGTGGGAAILLHDSSVLQSNDFLHANCEPMEDTTIQEQKQTENQFRSKYQVTDRFQSGRHRVKRKTSHHARLFPFKRLWNHVPAMKRSNVKKENVNR